MGAKCGGDGLIGDCLPDSGLRCAGMSIVIFCICEFDFLFSHHVVVLSKIKLINCLPPGSSHLDTATQQVVLIVLPHSKLLVRNRLFLLVFYS